MKWRTATGMTVLAALGIVGATPEDRPEDRSDATRPLQVRVETVANRDAGPSESCDAVQVQSASSAPSFSFWSTLGEGGVAGAGRSRGAAIRCGVGTYPGGSQPPSGATPAPSGGTAAPLLSLEVSAVVGWDSGVMDPGPVRSGVLVLTVGSRQRSGVAPVTDRRSTRLEPGEEQVVPVAVEQPGREALGVHEVLLRIRAEWVEREGATEYGAVAIREAAPGSEILLDRGVVGRAGPEGSLLLSNVPVGQRKVRLRGPSGSTVSRTVMVVKDRTVPVMPSTAGSGSPPPPTVTATGKNAQGFQEYRRGRDGAVMVEIPEGEFVMGNLQTEGTPLPHTVYVSAFLMDNLPLTVGRYTRFAAATGRPLPPDPYWGVHEDYPVAFVRWDEAKAYCEWAGGRLPTEAEREKAARGTDERLFPWGSEPPSPERAVFRRNWGEQGNDAAGIRPSGKSPYGLLDTGGNMWEFCEDWWDGDYFKSSPKKDPAGPKTGRARVVKGGSWDSRPTVLSASSRNFAYTGYREGDFGFRCAADLPH